ncbi:hypothetical protein [Nitrospira sp. Kam-Ns4a]
MAKRRTIGDNPLDAILPEVAGPVGTGREQSPNPEPVRSSGRARKRAPASRPSGQADPAPGASPARDTIDQAGRARLADKPPSARVGRAKGVGRGRDAAARGQEDAQAGGTPTAVPPASADLLPRLERLEQENQCLRWLIGAALAPLALIAILA